MTLEHRSARTADLDPVTLYRILQLRVDVFVVEQECAYPELDGRDLEPDAEQLWAEDGDAVLGTIRILVDDDALRIGRVATAGAARGLGLASELMRRGVDRCAEIDPAKPIVLDAQSHLVDWYARFGFAVDGDEYLEDGIPHKPMRRAAGS
jgi:ElaA protein